MKGGVSTFAKLFILCDTSLSLSLSIFRIAYFYSYSHLEFTHLRETLHGKLNETFQETSLLSEIYATRSLTHVERQILWYLLHNGCYCEITEMIIMISILYSTIVLIRSKNAILCLECNHPNWSTNVRYASTWSDDNSRQGRQGLPGDDGDVLEVDTTVARRDTTGIIKKLTFYLGALESS